MPRLRLPSSRWLLFWIVLLLFLWYFRTWFHGLVMLFYTYPAIPEALVLWYLLHRLLARSPKRWSFWLDNGKGNKRRVSFAWTVWILSPLLLVFLLVAGVGLANVARSVHLAQTLEYKKIDRLPDARENLRLMPLEVAYRYGRDSLQLSQYKLGQENIALINGKLSWMYPLVPDGLIITFTKPNAGILYLDATTQEKNSQIVSDSLKIGDVMQITDNLWWNLYRQRYFVTTESPFYLPVDGKVYTVTPAISYSFHVRWGIFYTVPEFAGVYLVSSDGKIEFLTPGLAQKHPLLAGNRLFPDQLARTYIEAYEYHKGVLNRFFVHEDQIDLEDVAQANPQPFLMITAAGPKWFFSCEPYGESHGIFKIFLVDAVSGEIDLYELPQSQTLTGPIRAMDYIRRSNPIVDWSRFRLVEPLPFISKGVLYWKVAVIPNDSAGIAFQAFLDSRNNEVVQTKTDQDIYRFVAGETLPTPAVPSPQDNAEVIKKIREKIREIEDLLKELQKSGQGQ